MIILKGHKPTKPVRSLAFSPDGTKLASSARDYKTFLWDLGTGRHEAVEESGSFTVAFSPDGKTLATGGSSNIMLRDTASRQSANLSIRIGEGGDWGYGWDVAYSPDGKPLAAVSGVLRVFDSASREEIPVTGVLPVGPDVPPNWTGTPAAQFATSSLAFSPDGALLATGHERPTKVVRLWNTATWQVQTDLIGSTATIDAIAFSPDGRHLAACAGTALLVWDVPTGNLVVRQTFNKQHCKDLAFTPNGTLLALARNDASVRFFSTASWTEVGAYDWRIGPMISLAMAPDGLRVAGGSGKGKIVVFDLDL